jgi:diguanylate cyclase (GGDEF)-like protein
MPDGYPLDSEVFCGPDQSSILRFLRELKSLYPPPIDVFPTNYAMEFAVMENSFLAELGFTDVTGARASNTIRFAPAGVRDDDRLLQSMVNKLADKYAQRKIMRLIQKGRDEAQQEIERLTVRNAQLQRQLESAWQREADALANAHRDELTGLPNRRLLKDRLLGAIAHADRDSKSVALLLIDLDDFKQINDTLGHSAGDQLLCQVAQRLTKCLRAVDTACRYGGDEFVVIFSELGSKEAVDAVITKVRDCLAPAYRIGGYDLHVSASMGRALYPEHASNDHALINHADAEMYAAKAARKMQSA